MPLIRYIQKITRDPNFLVWRDTVYVNVDNRPQYLSLKLVSDIDALLQGKISEYIFQSEFKEVKISCDEIRIIARNLVLEYLFYEGSGTVLHDTSGNKHNGTINGATWKQLINSKYVLYFDGVDDYVEVSPRPTVSRSYLSVEVLFNSPIYQSAVFLEHGLGGHFYLRFGWPSKKIHFRLWLEDGSSPEYESNSEYMLNKYTHYLATFNADKGNVAIYMNGTLDTTYNITQGLKLISANIPTTIGADITLSSFSKFYIATLRIFKKEVTSKEYETLYKLAKIAVPELS